MRQTGAFIVTSDPRRKEFPAPPHPSVKTQSDPCLDVHIN